MIFPQCEIDFPTSAQEILFVSGGRAPNRDWFKKIAVGRQIFCVDRGIELCMACNIVPSVLIGDFDSASSSAVDWARKMNVQVEKYPVDKDFTDIQLALSRATEIFGEHTAILTGAFGNGRFDHVFSTIFTCAATNRTIFLADEREIVFFLRNGESSAIKFTQKPLAVSFLPISATCEGISTKNLHWELENTILRQNFPNAVSNRVESEKISVKIDSGTLAIYFCFDE